MSTNSTSVQAEIQGTVTGEQTILRIVTKKGGKPFEKEVVLKTSLLDFILKARGPHTRVIQREQAIDEDVVRECLRALAKGLLQGAGHFPPVHLGIPDCRSRERANAVGYKYVKTGNSWSFQPQGPQLGHYCPRSQTLYTAPRAWHEVFLAYATVVGYNGFRKGVATVVGVPKTYQYGHGLTEKTSGYAIPLGKVMSEQASIEETH